MNTNATPATAPWDGATAKVVVSSNAVTSVEITDGGSAYTNGETLFFDSQTPALGGIGGSPNASLTIATAGISSALDIIFKLLVLQLVLIHIIVFQVLVALNK